ncbi:MAG: LCP family protein [Oscillibacter sp.]|nr:LCP family protein [Oscillibacter sp.]
MSHPDRRRRTVQILLIILLALITACVLVKAFFLRAPVQKTELPSLPAQQAETLPQDPETQEKLRSHYERKPGFYTILVSGVDNGNGGSDTNLLVAADTEGGHVYGVSIPRDAKVEIGGKARKLNYAYNLGGTEKLAEIVSAQLGIPVDYTVTVDLTGFTALVNAIGGIDFYVPLDMDYDDPVQDLHIHVSKGSQHLDGETALKVVRFRHNNDGTGYGSEDIGRMATQQNFLRAVAKKMLSASSLTKIDDYVRIFNRCVKTDLTAGNLAWLAGKVVEIGAENVDFCTLPNHWKSPYVYLDADEVLALVNERLNPYTEDRTEDDLHIPS